MFFLSFVCLSLVGTMTTSTTMVALDAASEHGSKPRRILSDCCEEYQVSEVEDDWYNRKWTKENGSTCGGMPVYKASDSYGDLRFLIYDREQARWKFREQLCDASDDSFVGATGGECPSDNEPGWKAICTIVHIVDVAGPNPKHGELMKIIVSSFEINDWIKVSWSVFACGKSNSSGPLFFEKSLEYYDHAFFCTSSMSYARNTLIRTHAPNTTNARSVQAHIQSEAQKCCRRVSFDLISR